jgi:SPP1 gp7 family putative phage head morphogenesis protein
MVQPIRKDPSGSKSVEKKFARQLVGLVNDYRGVMLRFVEQNQGRALEISHIPIGTGTLITSIHQLASMTIMQRANAVAEAAAAMAYTHGREWADKAISTKGVFNPVTKVQKLFYLPPERAAIERIAARNFMEIQGMTDEMAKRLSRSLVDGFEKGETMNLLIRRVREETDFGRNRSITIARTETMRAVNSAAKERYEQTGVERVEWLAAWDDRTCDECESKHGQIYDIGDAPDLPQHPNCRCCLSPVIGGQSE